MDVLGCRGLRGRFRDKLSFTASFRVPGERVGSSTSNSGGGWGGVASRRWALALPMPTLRTQTRWLQDLLSRTPGLQRGLSVGHRAILAMQELALLSVWPREDGVIAVQLGLGVHQAAAQHWAFLFDACSGGRLQLQALLISGIQDLVPAFPLGFSFLPLAAADHGPRQDSQGNDDDKGGDDNIQHTPLTVAVSISQLHLDEILHPKRVTDTALGERVAVAMV